MGKGIEGTPGEIDRSVKGFMRSVNVPGMSVAVTDRARVLKLSHYGLSDVAGRKPVTGQTLFQIGSISKSFTSIVLLQMQEEGLLCIDDPVVKHLPWFRVPSRYNPIKIRHLMNHSAGIPRGTDSTVSAFYEAWVLRRAKASAPPGTFFHYSNTGYKVLGLVIERILAMSCAKAVEERVMNPLGMSSSLATISGDLRTRTSVGYMPLYDDRPAPKGRPVAPAPWLDSETADGSISSTAGDMSRYVRFLLNKGRGPKSRLLSEKSFDLLTHPSIIYSETPRKTYYGLGLDVFHDRGESYIGHTGGMVGYVSEILLNMDLGIGVVLLFNANCDTNPATASVMRIVEAARHGSSSSTVQSLAEIDSRVSSRDYAGVYESKTGKVTIALKKGKLTMASHGSWSELDMLEKDKFVVMTDPPGIYLLTFSRADGRVVECTIGPESYSRQGALRVKPLSEPSEWNQYVGHYRQHNPWLPSFRVFVRKGTLYWADSTGIEEPLVRQKEGRFRVGSDPRSPEWIEFDMVQNGQSQRATLSGGDYFRVSIP